MISKDIGEKIYTDFQQYGIPIAQKGMIPVFSHADEDVILQSLREIICDASFVIGVSSSGNGIAIYVNKLPGFNAAPITSLSDAMSAINLFEANAFDISANNIDASIIYKELVEKSGGCKNEME